MDYVSSWTPAFDKKQGVYCGDCGRQRADHCQGCSICDAVGLLCRECFKAEVVQHQPAKPASNQPKYVQDFLDTALEA
jgi:hypothetical protein